MQTPTLGLTLTQFKNNYFLGDAYRLLQYLPDASVDACISDFPYGGHLTGAGYDKTDLDLPALWAQLHRVIKPGGAIITTAVQPFTTDLIVSNRANFRYDMVYRKKRKTGWLLATRRPLAEHESILVFSNGMVQPHPCDGNRAPRPTAVYNPQKIAGKPYGAAGSAGRAKKQRGQDHIYRSKPGSDKVIPNLTGDRHPGTVWEVSISNKERGLHPAQKPQELYERLLRTYTNPGDLVLDPFAGSGTTGAAAEATSREYILFENAVHHYKAGLKRLGKQHGLTIVAAVCPQVDGVGERPKRNAMSRFLDYAGVSG